LSAQGKELKNKAKFIPAKLFMLTGLSKVELVALQTDLDHLIKNTEQHL